MICFSCDGGKESAFQQETFPCGCCDGENTLEYNLCPDCGMMWRAVNGVPIEKSPVNIQELGDFSNITLLNDKMFNQTDLTEDDQEILDKIGEHLVKISKMDKGAASMGDYVHKCLQCNSTAVDVSDGIYECTEPGCGFKWEVVKFE